MIAGGEIDGTQDELTEVVELVKTNSTPYFGYLPTERRGPVGTMLGNAPILCGGYYPGDGYDHSCLSYHQDSEWILSQSMVQARQYAAGVKVNTTAFWIMGGYDGSSMLDSTEFIIQGQTNAVPGPKLPYKLRLMCAVKRSENE